MEMFRHLALYLDARFYLDAVYLDARFYLDAFYLDARFLDI